MLSVVITVDCNCMMPTAEKNGDVITLAILCIHACDCVCRRPLCDDFFKNFPRKLCRDVEPFKGGCSSSSLLSHIHGVTDFDAALYLFRSNEKGLTALACAHLFLTQNIF